MTIRPATTPKQAFIYSKIPNKPEGGQLGSVGFFSQKYNRERGAFVGNVRVVIKFKTSYNC